MDKQEEATAKITRTASVVFIYTTIDALCHAQLAKCALISRLDIRRKRECLRAVY